MGTVKILVSTDGSAQSEKAIDAAVELSMKLGAELVGMTAMAGAKPEGETPLADPVVRDRLSVIERKCKESNVPCELTVAYAESISKGILDCARQHDVAFIVMGSRGLSSLGSLFLGSETQKVLHEADRPVLVVR